MYTILFEDSGSGVLLARQPALRLLDIARGETVKLDVGIWVARCCGLKCRNHLNTGFYGAALVRPTDSYGLHVVLPFVRSAAKSAVHSEQTLATKIRQPRTRS